MGLKNSIPKFFLIYLFYYKIVHEIRIEKKHIKSTHRKNT